MSYLTQPLRRRNVRAIVSAFISYLMLAGQVAPLVMAAGTPATTARRVAPATAAAPRPAAAFDVGGVNATGPVITATKVDAFPDPNNDTKADPGETITYTVTVTNTGDSDATGVQFNDTIDPNTTLVPGSVNTQPIAEADSYNVIGNVRIQPNAAAGLLANDRDPDSGNNTGLTASGPTTTTQGGNISISSDGSFTYNPAPGFAGTDTVTYTITDPGGKTDTAVATFKVGNGTSTPGTNVIWFVDANAATGGDGRLTSPFKCLVGPGCFDPTAADDPGDTIFVAAGTYADAGVLNLLNGQRLLGQGATGTIPTDAGYTVPANSDTLPTLNGNPATVTITSSANGIGIGTGSSNELRGFTVGNVPSANSKIVSPASPPNAAFGTLTVSEVALSGTGQALSLDNGTLAATFTSITSTSSASQGIALDQIAGSLSSGSTNVSGNLGQCMFVTNSTAAMSFGNTTCTGGTDGISLASNSGANTRTFGTLTVSGGTGNAFRHATGGGNVTVNGAASLGSGNDPVEISGVASGQVINFAGGATVSKTTTGGEGVHWSGTNTGGTLTFATLALTTSNGTGMNLSGGGTVNVTTAAGSSITSTGTGTQAAPAINASGVALGMSFTTVTANGPGAGTGTGISLATVTGSLTVNNGAGTSTNIQNTGGAGISVTGSSATLSFGNTVVNGPGSTGVILGGSGAGNSGTITFGDLDITPDANQRALLAQQNTGAITIASGTVSSTGAVVVEITGVDPNTRTPLNVQFDSVSANGNNTQAKGLILANTSASGSPGGFRVNGTGTTDGSGGTIQNTTTRGADIQNVQSLVLKNMNFTSANSSVDGGAAGVCDDLTLTGCNGAIFMNGVTTLATFDNLNVNGTMVENGITAINVVNFKLDNSVLTGCGDEGNESCVEAQNLSGVSTVNNTTITFSETNAFDVVNNDASLNLTVSNSTFSDSQTSGPGCPSVCNGEGGIQFRSFSRGSLVGGITPTANVPTTTINILNSSFLRLRTQGIQVFSNDDSILNLDVTGNNIDAQNDIGTGVDLNAAGTSTYSFNILNNPHIRSRGGAAVNVTSFDSGHIEGRVNSNPDIQVLGGAGIPVRVLAQDTSQLIVEVNGNTVSNFNTTTNTGGTEDTMIDVQSRFQSARADVTITNNTITGDPTGIAGINLIAGSSAASETNITCGDVSGNNVANAAGNTLRGFRVRVSDLDTTSDPKIFLEGFVEAGTSLQDVEATWNGRTNLPVSAAGSEVAVSLTASASAPAPPPGGQCFAVDTPSDFAPAVLLAPSAAQQVKTQSAVVNPRPTVIARPSAPRIVAAPAVKTTTARPAVTAVTPAQPSNQSAASVKPAATSVPRPRPRLEAGLVNVGGQSISVNIGTLHAGDSVTITFQVTVNNPYAGGPNVSNQGTVSGSNFTSVLTDDTAPSAPGAADPTLTPINSVKIRVNDATVAETTSTTQMLFTVVLSAPATGPMSVQYATANDVGGANPATGGASCGGSVDYETTSGTLNFAAGERVKTVPVNVCADTDSPEQSETLLLNIMNPSNGTIVDAQAVGTITQGNAAGTFIISELRTRGPAGNGDDFVELYNNTSTPLTINDGSGISDAAHGYGVFKMGADCNAAPVLVGVIPNGTVIPARGHYLFVGSQYSLANYGGTGAAAGDQTMTSDIEDDHNVAVFSTADVDLLSSTTRLDAVGFGTNTAGVCALLKEGTNLPAVTGTTTEHSFFRKECDFVEGAGCAASGNPKDSNDNAADFLFADTAGTTGISSVVPHLGAPGPERSTSPVRRDTSGIGAPLLDQSVSSAASINRDRNFASDPVNNSQFGTMTIRRRVSNNTGSTVTRLRVRVIELTTGPNPPAGTADLRARTSVDEVNVGPINDASTCLAGTGSSTTPCTVTVKGTTLEQPPTQGIGGGYNSTLSVPLPGGGLADGSSVLVEFVLGVQQTGRFRFYIIVEALP